MPQHFLQGKMSMETTSGFEKSLYTIVTLTIKDQNEDSGVLYFLMSYLEESWG